MQWDDRIGRRLTLRDLHILMSVAQSGSMGKAASELAISQPAVSKAIADIEHTLKVRLLDRTPLGVEPTRYGHAVLKWGNAVFDDLRQSVKEIEYLSDPTSGELHLGCTEPMSAGFVPAIIDRLTRQYPKMVFHVTQGDPATLQDRELRSRNIELAVGRILEPYPAEGMNAEVLFNETVYVGAGADNKMVRRRKVELVDLIDEPWTLPPTASIAYSYMSKAFSAAGLAMPQATAVTFSLQFASSLLATGRYLGLVPGSMLRFSGKRLGLKVVPVELAVRPGPAGIVTLKNRTLSPLAQLFIETAREIAKPLAKFS